MDLLPERHTIELVEDGAMETLANAVGLRALGWCDGMLVEFPSIVDAMRCAVEVQRGMAEFTANVPEGTRIEFRPAIIRAKPRFVDHDFTVGDAACGFIYFETAATPSARSDATTRT